MDTQPAPRSANPAPSIRDAGAQDVAVEVRHRPMRRAWMVAAGVALVLAVALLWPALSRFSSAERSVSVDRLRLATVTRGRFVSDVSAQGRIVAAVSPTLYAPALGTVTLAVQAGDRVEKGQALAEVESPDILNEFSREEANLQGLEVAASRARIDTQSLAARNQQAVDLAKVTMEAAERELKRSQEAHSQGLLPQVEADRRADELATARVRHAHALAEARLAAEAQGFEQRTRQLDVERQKLAVANQQRRVDELTVRAPVSGVVGTVAVQQKAAVSQNQPLLTVVDLSAFEVEVLVPENYAQAMGIGMGAEIAYGERRYPGTVAAISPEVQNNQVVTRVRFAGDAPPDLRQNQRVSVRVLLDEREQVLSVARGPFLESGAGRSAYRVRDGLAERVPITIGATSISMVEILDGLTEGDQIVISGTDSFENAETLYLRD